MRPVALALLACLLVPVLAGCLGSSSPRTPTGPHDPWASEDAGTPWIALSMGCGFCGPIAAPVHQAALLDDAGNAMLVRYGINRTADQDLIVDPPFTAYTDWLAAFVADGQWAYQEAGAVHVQNITLSRLTGDDWRTVQRVLKTSTRHLVDGPPPDLSGCADCAPAHLDVLPDHHVQRMGIDRDAWGTVQDQMDRLRVWLSGFPAFDGGTGSP